MRASALFAALFVAGAAAESAFLLVHKNVDSPAAVATRNLTVSVTVFNVGGSNAFDVALDDSTWPAEATVSGAEKSWEIIEPRGSVTHEYTVLLPRIPAVPQIETAPAKVTFAAEPKGEVVRTVLSNDIIDVHYPSALSPQDRMKYPRNLLEVLSPEEADRRHSRRVKEWVTFVFLLIIPVLMPFTFWNQASKSLEEKRSTILRGVGKTDSADPKRSSRGSGGSGKKGRRSGSPH